MRFRGIRYGRASWFERPVAEPFSGDLVDHGWGDSCPQLDSPPGIEWACSRVQPESEDCLNLNVFTPSLEGRRPVLVWVHGGGLHAGSSSQPMYEGSALAEWGDVVVVSVNHRLNAYGFVGGNQGLLDLVLALEWVRDNVAGFGGDPGAVTVFGQSGGGAKVAALVCMPAAAGLVHRAIVQSGTTVELHDQAEVDATFFDAYDGSDVLAGVEAVFARHGVMAFRPRADDDLPALVLPDIPILFGSTEREYEAGGARMPLPDAGALAGALAGLGVTWPAERLDGETWGEAFGRIFTAWSRDLVDRSAAAAPRAWRYSFEWGGSPHGAELPLVFRTGSAFPGEPAAPPELVDEVSGAWVRFARTGELGWPPDEVRTFA